MKEIEGDTVLYLNWEDLRRALDYDLEQERAYSYKGKSRDEMISHLTRFVSGLWQIHAFGEGNTRTAAVFTIQYLRSLGFDVDNDQFARHSWYFRNALVRAKYPDKHRTSTGQVQDKLHTENSNIVKLVQVIGEQEWSVKEMMNGVELKGRDNFLNLYLNPAIAEGYVRLLYPKSPRHPRQRYLLTVKGLALYNEIKK